MTNSKKQRNLYVDVVKGVGILLVVFGHNWIILNEKGEAFNILFSFHVPLFFLISGLFFKQQSSLKGLTLSKADSLLKPYFVIALPLALAYAVIKSRAITTEVLNIFHANGDTLTAAPMWFLPHLFAIFIVSWILLKVLSPLNQKFQWIAVTALFVTNIMVLNYFKDNLRLPFTLDIIFISSGFFLLGYFAKSHILNFKPNLKLTLSALIIFIGCHTLFNDTIDLNLRIYDDLFISTIESLCGIYLILAFSYALTYSPTVAKTLSYIGSATLFILIFHLHSQSQTFGLLTETFGANTYFAAALSFIAGVIFPLLIYIVVKKLPLMAMFLLPIKDYKKK